MLRWGYIFICVDRFSTLLAPFLAVGILACLGKLMVSWNSSPCKNRFDNNFGPEKILGWNYSPGKNHIDKNFDREKLPITSDLPLLTEFPC